MLKALQSYMRQHKEASSADLAQYLNTTEAVVETMVAHFMRKGQLTEKSSQDCKDPCVTCHCKSYIWIEDLAQSD